MKKKLIPYVVEDNATGMLILVTGETTMITQMGAPPEKVLLGMSLLRSPETLPIGRAVIPESRAVFPTSDVARAGLVLMKDQVRTIAKELQRILLMYRILDVNLDYIKGDDGVLSVEKDKEGNLTLYVSTRGQQLDLVAQDAVRQNDPNNREIHIQ